MWHHHPLLLLRVRLLNASTRYAWLRRLVVMIEHRRPEPRPSRSTGMLDFRRKGLGEPL